MTKNNPDSNIEHKLAELKRVSPRDPQKANQGRARFLSEAAKYQKAVSPSTYSRQSGWKYIFRKEKLALNTLISFILASVMLLGGGATAVAAQDDLPTQPLYPVKLWTENATLALTGDPDAKANLLMNMSQTRVNEISALVNADITPPNTVYNRFEQHIQQTLTLASNMDDAALTRTLTQLQQQIQTQEQTMAQLQNQANVGTDPLLAQMRQMLQNHLRLVEQGLVDPQGFRQLVRNEIQFGQDWEATPTPTQQQSQFGQGPQETETPSGGNDSSGDNQGDNDNTGNGNTNGDDDTTTSNGGNGNGTGNGNGGGGGGGGGK